LSASYPLRAGGLRTIANMAPLLQTQVVQNSDGVTIEVYASRIMVDGCGPLQNDRLYKCKVRPFCACQESSFREHTLILCLARARPMVRPEGPAPTITTGGFSMPIPGPQFGWPMPLNDDSQQLRNTFISSLSSGSDTKRRCMLGSKPRRRRHSALYPTNHMSGCNEDSNHASEAD
jgi:hypothetical protein